MGRQGNSKNVSQNPVYNIFVIFDNPGNGCCPFSVFSANRNYPQALNHVYILKVNMVTGKSSI